MNTSGQQLGKLCNFSRCHTETVTNGVNFAVTILGGNSIRISYAEQECLIHGYSYSAQVVYKALCVYMQYCIYWS